MTEDAIIIGGGFAGLSAATILARARRRVTIFDTGTPRNRFASHSHGVLALDGKPGTAILEEARAQLSRYPTVTFVQAAAERLEGERDDFRVVGSNGEAVHGRRVLLSTGFEDILPDVPGLAQFWGERVLHCPYCHGYELGGGALGVLASGPMSAHQATLLADWGDVTLFTNEQPEPDAQSLSLLVERNVSFVSGKVEKVAGGDDGGLVVSTAHGYAVSVKGLFVAPQLKIRGGIPQALGLATAESRVGPTIAIDGERQTSLPGLYAAGDIVLGAANITLASADGVTAGLNIHRSLIWPSA
ncbi:NAD(P)/FAD-dependent oxidoreductase [Mycoplana rhizolycopersici]|uniref:Thioredoxin reductase n=1 Tax=Mycoplana rhizolycopersici TaxID=2746702 RepID=A0ABX2QA17_9HYPH|nr:NAD(P)/FAD-dependent oxidoreductase [Rhizobium rhizolycopersici]NVP54577.1 NAD(P)/FAD-dependent oxidoreductase [Rhizobium rhizolycopersici]